MESRWNFCPITDLEVKNFNQHKEISTYEIKIQDFNYQISLCNNCFGKKWEELVRPFQHIFRGLIANKQWLPAKYEVIHLRDGHKEIETYHNSSIESILRESNYPKTIKEKLDFMLELLYSKQNYEGEEININTIFSQELFKTYCKNKREAFYYVNTLVDNEMLKIIDFAASSEFKSKIPNLIEISFKGLNHLVSLQEEGERSNNVFVAMAFDKETVNIRKAISGACDKTGFNPIIIDEEHLGSDQTINDGIIASLKKSKFCIADFTFQRRGVYFESGYAAGQNKKVIYTCRKDDFEKSHFDTNHFQHIVYESDDELEKSLVNKINAWIK